MATEQENLVLNVTLVDNASAGLDKLNQQLKQLGGEQHSSAQSKLRTNFAGVQNAIKPLVGDFSRLSTTMGNVTKSAMSMIPALTGVGTAVLGVSGVLMAALIPIKRFASEMTDLGQLARETGFNAASIKIFREEFGKLFGSQGIALADTTLRGLQRSMTDILNPASKLRQELEQGARHTPEMRENMDKLIGRLKEAAQKGDATEFFNIFEEGMDNIRKNISDMPNRGPVVAAQWVNDLNKLAGIPEAVAATHIKLKGPTEEAIRNTQALIEQSTQLTRSFNSMSVSVGKISESLSAIVLGFGPVVKGAQLLADAMERIAAAADRWARTRSGNLTPEEKAEQEKLTNDIFKNAPQYPGRGLPPPATPQRFSGGGANDNTKLIEEENKRMSELTAEIKRLTDLMMVPTDKPQGSAFHNTPRGGAKGESNPMKIPAGVKQPGGGAAAEAREPVDLSSPPPGAMTALELAGRHLGAHELRDTAKLQQFMKDQGFEVNPKTTAWCATYANSVLAATGFKTSSPLAKEGAAAGSFLNNPEFKPASVEDIESGYGTYVGVVKGQSPRTHVEGKHVGLLTGETRINPQTGKLEIRMRGGNQPEQEGGAYSGEGRVVSDRWFEADKLHLRRAPATDTAKDQEIAQNFSASGPLDEVPEGNGLSFAQRAKAQRQRNKFLSGSPMSTNIEDRRFIDPDSLDETVNEHIPGRDFTNVTPGNVMNRIFKRDLGNQLGLDDISSDRKILDRTMGGEISNHRVEGSADIEVNVKRSGNGNSKPSTLFKMPKMERQSSGTPASRGPAEDISGGENSGIYT